MPIGERKLTLDPNDKDQTLNFAERSERLRELVARNKAAGLSAHDPRYVVDLLREVNGMADGLVFDKKYIHSVDIPLDGFSPAGECIIFNQGELFLRVKNEDQKESILDIEGKPINDFPAARSFISTFLYKGELIFPLTDADSGALKFLNKKGEQISLDIRKFENNPNVIVDESGEIGYVRQYFPDQDESVSGNYRLLDMAGRFESDFLEDCNCSYESGVLYYRGDRWAGESVSGFVDRKGNHITKEGNVSMPFRFNNQILFIEANNDNDDSDPNAVMYSSYIWAIDQQDRDIGIGINVEDGNVFRIVKVIAGEKAVYFTASVNKDSDWIVKLFKFDGQQITPVDVPCSKDAEIEDFFLLNNRLVVLSHVENQKESEVYIEGVTQNATTHIRGGGGDSGYIKNTNKPITIEGKTGEIFFLSNAHGSECPKLWIDNQSSDLPVGNYDNFDVIEDHVFWSYTKTRTTGPRTIVDGDSYLWVDGKQTQYSAEKILKVVSHGGKCFMLGLKDQKLIVREIKI